MALPPWPRSVQDLFRWWTQASLSSVPPPASPWTDQRRRCYGHSLDILGDEDHLGDMDFKVVGTSEGITALQMDIKIRGLSREIVEKSLNQARDERFHILDIMNASMEEPRKRAFQFCSTFHHPQDPTWHDRQGDRSWRQSDQGHRRKNRSQDEHRWRRNRIHRIQRSCSRCCPGYGKGPDTHRGNRPDLYWTRQKSDGFRRFVELFRERKGLCISPIWHLSG